MKTFIRLFLPALIITMIINAGASYMKNRPHVYTEDYPALYENQLRIMFGSDYETGEKRTVEIEAENCGCGYHAGGYIYDEWEITYKDQYGYPYTQILNNRESLEAQQLDWLKTQLSVYYKRKYLLNRFPEGTFQDLSADDYFGKSYCFIFIGSPVSSYTSDRKEEYEKTKENGNNYYRQLMQSLQDEQNMLHFYELDYETVFEAFPVTVSVDLSIDDADLHGKEKEYHEEKLRQEILKVMDEWNQDTNETGNLEMYISSNNGGCDLYDGARSWRYYILRGQWFEPEENDDSYDSYDWKLYEANEGVFW